MQILTDYLLFLFLSDLAIFVLNLSLLKVKFASYLPTYIKKGEGNLTIKLRGSKNPSYTKTFSKIDISYLSIFPIYP